MGEFFQNDFKQFEIQIMKVIEGYYLYKNNEQLLFVNDKKKTEEKIIEYLNDKMNNENINEKKYESLISLIDKIKEKGIYDLANLLNICKNFCKYFYNQEKKRKKKYF